MTTSPLIDAAALAAALAGPTPPRVLDASFDLADPAAGRRAHDAAHVPGALHVDLDRDLSSTKTGRNGRHPLPTREAFAETLRGLGLHDDDEVVIYDGSAGMYAARLWWMLRWVGHGRVRLLDGGFAAWQAAGGAVSAAPTPAPVRGTLTLRASLVPTVDFEAVRANLDTGARQVIDARAPDRFRGENETLDPVAGHIPGAKNRLFRDNLGPDGRFKPAAQLRAEFDALTGGLGGGRLIAQCGSGVTACHNLVAMELAGLGGAALYPGSWSEWCAQPGAPVATGAA